MLECVANVSEGRDPEVLRALERACGASLLDVHTDADHHRSVFTLAGPDATDAYDAAQSLARSVAAHVDLSAHTGVHPRLGALDVVPFVALAGRPITDAVRAARDFAEWIAEELHVPAFLYDAAAGGARSLPQVRASAFREFAPDAGPATPHPRMGAVAVGARPPMIAVNCELATDDLAVAKRIAHAVRERDGGLPGVRALGFPLDTVGHAQVSMNLVALERTGLQAACDAVRGQARDAGTEVVRVELVGLLPADELARCDAAFVAFAGLTEAQTIEGRMGGRCS
ncbi:MAG: glutamate formiminotransferase [Acidimicrobiia bacterium]